MCAPNCTQVLLNVQENKNDRSFVLTVPKTVATDKSTLRGYCNGVARDYAMITGDRYEDANTWRNFVRIPAMFLAQYQMALDELTTGLGMDFATCDGIF